MKYIAAFVTMALFAISAFAIPAPAARYMVKPVPGIPDDVVASDLVAHGAVEVDLIGQINVHVITVPSVAVAGLMRNPHFEFVEQDVAVKPAVAPVNDPLFVNEWHIVKINATNAWQTTAGANVIVAVCDTGVDSTHVDLAANMVAGWNFYDNNSTTTDVYGHGTTVAGTVAAIANNALGGAGIAYSAKIMPLRISDTSGYSYGSIIAKAITYAADHGCRVANVSYMMSESSTVAAAAQYMQTKGGVVTISAGNYTTDIITADNPYVLTVSATDSADKLASFSNFGNIIDVSAPGVTIQTTLNGGGYGYASGTSYSAPVTAAVAALVIGANPGLTGPQVQNIIKSTADDLGTVGWDKQFGMGRVNASRAVYAALATGGDLIGPSVVIKTPYAGATVTGVVDVQVTASDNVGVTKIELNADGVLVGESTGVGTTTTVTFVFDSADTAAGPCVLQAIAYDAVGNTGIATNIITVTGTTNGIPVMVFTAPQSDTVSTKMCKLIAAGTDDVLVTKTEIYIDNKLVARATTPTISYNWNTAKWTAEAHTVVAKAYDAAGEVGTATRTMTVVR